MLCFIFVFLILLTQQNRVLATDLHTVKQALEYVFEIREETCGAGTGEVLPLQFDVSAWIKHIDPAVSTANMLSEIIALNNGTLDSLTDEMFYLLVRNNVRGDSVIFGSGIGLEKGVYRISEIFTVGARKRVNLPDKALFQRLGLLMCFVVFALGAWSAGMPPEVVKLKTSEDLIFYVCKYGPFEYAVIAAEILLLVYGVYLCFNITKVPAQLNDNYMTYAMYNAIILGIFMTFLFRLLISVLGPDLTLVFQFLQLQVFATVTLLIIFIPKFLVVKRAKETNMANTGVAGGTSTKQIQRRSQKALSGAFGLNVSFLESSDKSTQTDEKPEK